MPAEHHREPRNWPGEDTCRRDVHLGKHGREQMSREALIYVSGFQVQVSRHWRGKVIPTHYGSTPFACGMKVHIDRTASTFVAIQSGCLQRNLETSRGIDHFIRRFPQKKILFCVPTVALAKQHWKVVQERSTVTWQF